MFFLLIPVLVYCCWFVCSAGGETQGLCKSTLPLSYTSNFPFMEDHSDLTIEEIRAHCKWPDAK